MPTLHHLPLSPFCRKVRVALGEKGLPIDLVEVRPWERDRAFLSLNPAGAAPVLVLEEGGTIADSNAIVEFIDEIAATPPLLGTEPLARAETRRLVAWFDDKFNREVTQPLYGEKVLKRIKGGGAPDSGQLRAGRANLAQHLDYIGWLCDRRTWLAGDHFSLADIAAGAHLSVIDFIGDVPWERFDGAKLWYQRIKSRPSFRPLLADRVSGFIPPASYANLDF